MRELVVRSLATPPGSGDNGALDSARMLAAEIENPALGPLIDAHS